MPDVGGLVGIDVSMFQNDLFFRLGWRRCTDRPLMTGLK